MFLLKRFGCNFFALFRSVNEGCNGEPYEDDAPDDGDGADADLLCDLKEFFIIFIYILKYY